MPRSSYFTPARAYAKGIGDAVADRTINRKKPDGTRETWAEVAERVSVGNSLLEPRKTKIAEEFDRLHHHLRQASLLMSGRHLQHGDENQPSRNMEVFTNCATAASTFLLFYLLLNGSGVGRCYDDDMMLVDYAELPLVICTIRADHPDVLSGEIQAPTTEHVLDQIGPGHNAEVHHVGDSREGWAKAYELMELRAFERKHRDSVLVLDFSGVREKGQPIKGMQNRPASGPGPLMTAIDNLAKLRDAGYEPWEAAMHADHYAADCVLVGGARRAARMATKTWRDKSIFKFIKIKQEGGLWSSNNSVTVDRQFWQLVRMPHNSVPTHLHDLWDHARLVFEAITTAAYFGGADGQGRGEPGIINVDMLSWNDKGIEELYDGDFAKSSRYELMPETKRLNARLAWVLKEKPYKVITNPCGEIVLILIGGYCVIADVVPFHAAFGIRDHLLMWNGDESKFLVRWDADAEDAFRTATRALMRVNLMDSLYKKEVRRTNRIGVGFTGIHEYAWARFGYGFRDLIDEGKSKDFWMTLARFALAVDEEAKRYARELGVEVPHTLRTVKPAGTTSKLFGLTEGAHLPAMLEYLRWVQFRNDDPLIETYRAKGYPVRKLVKYSGTTIVGFPTQPTICTLGMGDKLVTAADATPEEQYQWIRLLEKYWIRGVDEDGVALGPDRGNQVSYTLKYDPKRVSYDDFRAAMLNGQATVRACSVMPQEDKSAYEYLPETPVTKAEFEQIAASIDKVVHEDVGFEHVDCASGACPVDFNARKVA
jgi:hypothetical protein